MKKAASAANIRPILPAAVMRSAPFVVVVDDEVGFKLPELSVPVVPVCAAVTTAGVTTVFDGEVVVDDVLGWVIEN
jgi:hypothetical protein